MEGNATVPPIQFKLELSPRELLELALWLERCGVEFYRFLAEEQSREKLRGFYLRLMGMEMEHENWIRRMIQSLNGEFQPRKLAFDESLTGREYILRFRQAIEEKVFPVGINFLFDLDNFASPRDAIPFAKNIKIKILAIYQLLLGFQLSEPARKIMESLIAEGQEHLQEIEAILKSAN